MNGGKQFEDDGKMEGDEGGKGGGTEIREADISMS